MDSTQKMEKERFFMVFYFSKETFTYYHSRENKKKFPIVFYISIFSSMHGFIWLDGS